MRKLIDDKVMNRQTYWRTKVYVTATSFGDNLYNATCSSIFMFSTNTQYLENCYIIWYKEGQTLVSSWCFPGSYYTLLCCFALDWTTTKTNFCLKSIWKKSTQLGLILTFLPITIIVERIIFILIPFWVRSMEYFRVIYKYSQPSIS